MEDLEPSTEEDTLQFKKVNLDELRWKESTEAINLLRLKQSI